MSWTKIGGATKAGDGLQTTTGFNSSGATLLYVYVTSGSTTNDTFSDSVGGNSNTWQTLSVATSGGTAGLSKLYYCINPTHTGAGHTITANTTFGWRAFDAWSGADTTVSLADKTSTNTSATTTIQPGSITPTTNGQLIVTGCFEGAALDTTALTISSPFGIQEHAEFVSSVNYGSESLATYIQPTAAAINPTWTSAGSSTGAIIASFKASAGGGGGSPLFRQNNLTGVGAGGPFFQNPLTRSILGWRKPKLVLA